MKLPGPDHPIDIAYNPKRVQVLYQGHLIADTRGALSLTEATYKPVAYIPREDVRMDLLERTDRVTTCPFKGEANYFSIRDGHDRDDNAVWTYETPKGDVAEIASHLAFYPNRVEILKA